MLTITDVLGQVVYTAPVTTTKVNVNTGAFRSGVYFVTLMNKNGEKQVVKFIRH